MTQHLLDLLAVLEQRGYVAVPMLLDPRGQGMCQRRVRLYVVAVKNLRPLDFIDVREKSLQLAQQVLSMDRLPLRPVETFMFPDSSDDFALWDTYAFV